MEVSERFLQRTREITSKIEEEMHSRTYRTANELRNQAMIILGQQGGGRRYRVPGHKVRYTASAPGQPPANRTGAFRASWKPAVTFGNKTYIARIESGIKVGKYDLAQLLDEGSPGGQLAPRPYAEKTIEKAKPGIKRIFSERFL